MIKLIFLLLAFSLADCALADEPTDPHLGFNVGAVQGKGTSAKIFHAFLLSGWRPGGLKIVKTMGKEKTPFLILEILGEKKKIIYKLVGDFELSSKEAESGLVTADLPGVYREIIKFDKPFVKASLYWNGKKMDEVDLLHSIAKDFSGATTALDPAEKLFEIDAEKLKLTELVFAKAFSKRKKSESQDVGFSKSVSCRPQYKNPRDAKSCKTMIEALILIDSLYNPPLKK